jgi:hypothetical protein
MLGPPSTSSVLRMLMLASMNGMRETAGASAGQCREPRQRLLEEARAPRGLLAVPGEHLQRQDTSARKRSTARICVKRTVRSRAARERSPAATTSPRAAAHARRPEVPRPASRSTPRSLAREAQRVRSRARERAHDRQQQREREHPLAQADLAEPGHVHGAERDDRVHADARERQPEPAAENGHERVLGDELPHQAPAARAERGAHQELALARDAAREQQARDIRPRDQEQQRDRAMAPQRLSHARRGAPRAGPRGCRVGVDARYSLAS